MECGAAAVMLGHTLDDQAETVLLGLARGSGARSLAGMHSASGRYLRPLLGLRRGQTGAACAALGLEPWEDPHNADPAYARTRVRHQVLPVLEARARPRHRRGARPDRRPAAGRRGRAGRPGDAARPWAGLGRTAADGRPAGDRSASLEVAALAALPAAIRTRVLRRAAIAAGCPAGALTARHVAGLDALVTLARPALVGPAGRYPGPAAVWQADLLAGPHARDRTTWQNAKNAEGPVDATDMGADLAHVLITPERLQARIAELAAADRRRLRRPRPAAGRRAQGRGHGDGRPGPGDAPAGQHGLDGHVVVRLRHQVIRRGADPQGPGRATSPAGTCWSSRTSSTPG